MYNNRKKTIDEYPHAETAVWACTKEGCNGWMRDNFTFDAVPACPICSSEMASSVRMLPLLENVGGGLKSTARGVTI